MGNSIQLCKTFEAEEDTKLECEFEIQFCTPNWFSGPFLKLLPPCKLHIWSSEEL